MYDGYPEACSVLLSISLWCTNHLMLALPALSHDQQQVKSQPITATVCCSFFEEVVYSLLETLQATV